MKNVILSFIFSLFPNFQKSVDQELVPKYSSYDCYAYTACPQGGYISCRVVGNSSTGSACYWYVVPYQMVKCIGYDNNGYWQTYVFTC